MIHVGTQEDVLSCLADGWKMWGRREAPPKRAYTYWLECRLYPAKRVSPRIVAALIEAGRICGAPNAYGDMIYQLGAQTTLTEAGNGTA
jgi:hypothetical protein